MIPVINMISVPQHRAEALTYLLMYNLAFIAPLLAVFALAAGGVTSQKMAKFFEKRVAWVKLGLAAIFIALAAAIISTLV